MQSWRDTEGRVATLAELKGDRLTLQPTAQLQEALRAVWIPCVFSRGSLRVALGPWHWPTVRPLLPVDLVAHVEAERPAWLAWMAQEEAARAARPANPLAKVALGAVEAPADSDHPWHRLYPFQRVGVQWIHAVGLRGVVGDDMGVGKTPQGWMALELDANARRTLIVCPGSVLIHWMREGARWAPRWTASVAWSTKDVQKLAAAPYPDRHATIVSWGLLSRPATVEALGKVGFDAVIADEAHYAKNSEAARTQALVRLMHGARVRLPLTGTPIKSRPAEFWTLLHMIDPIRFHTFYPFGETFCGAKNRHIGLRVVRVYTGSARLPQLAKLTTPYVLRREKLEVLVDLPPKRRQTLPLRAPPDLVEESVDLLQKLRDQAKAGQETPQALGEIGKLRQRIGLEKVPAAVEWAVDAHQSGEPTVLFVFHQEVAAQLRIGLEKAGLRVGSILGSTGARERQPIVDAFQAGDLDVMIGSEAIKEGVTLTRAALSLQVEYWWTPGDHDQAEDRLCRNTQTRPVLNVYLQLEGTLDDHIAKLIEKKRDVVTETLDRDAFHRMTLRQLSANA